MQNRSVPTEPLERLSPAPAPPRCGGKETPRQQATESPPLVIRIDPDLDQVEARRRHHPRVGLVQVAVDG
jgi:hypothetical protein